jgi:hypothetical protein
MILYLLGIKNRYSPSEPSSSSIPFGHNISIVQCHILQQASGGRGKTFGGSRNRRSRFHSFLALLHHMMPKTDRGERFKKRKTICLKIFFLFVMQTHLLEWLGWDETHVRISSAMKYVIGQPCCGTHRMAKLLFIAVSGLPHANRKQNR